MAACTAAAAHWQAVLAGGLAVAGVAGAAAQAATLYTNSLPATGAPPALGVYLAALTAAFSLEALWWHAGPRHALRHPLPPGRCASACRRWGTALADVAAALLCVGYLVGYRLDGALWCLPLGAALALITLAVFGGGGARGAQAAADDAKETGDDAGFSLLLEQEDSTGTAAADGEASINRAGAAAPAVARAPCLACAPRGTPWHVQLGACGHSTLWGVMLLMLLMLLGGCGTIAVGWHRYGPRGSFFDIPLPGGGTQRLHAWCTGPPPSPALPTIWLEVGGGGHSSSDTYGLQFALNAAGRRVCTHDPPGTGWSRLSPDVQPVALPNAELTHSLMAAMGEPGPFVLVGTMDDGAQKIYAFALAHPDNVAALVPMQYGVNEFLASAAYYNWTQQYTAQQATATLRSRLALADAIRFLAVPWGLMSALAPSSPTFVPAGWQAECHFLNLQHEGQWDMQARVLAAQAASPATTVLAPDLWAANRSLASHIPVLAIDNPSPDPCGDAGAAPGSAACAAAQLQVALNTGFMRAMTTMTPGSVFTTCQGGPAVCADWLGGGSTVPFVTAAILGFLPVGNATVTAAAAR